MHYAHHNSGRRKAAPQRESVIQPATSPGRLNEHTYREIRHLRNIVFAKRKYKIKLRGAGYRLVYSVEDEIITVTVIGVGKRENDAVYKMTRHRS
ncbi:hypothetical protein FQB87_10915 [Salmonella enterica subsp. enterica]|nr:hypothetical protein [Salmonella enterica subsp. enterica serovar Veneziana]